MSHTVADIHIDEKRKKKKNHSLTQNLIGMFLLQMAEHKGAALEH